MGWCHVSKEKCRHPEVISRFDQHVRCAMCGEIVEYNGGSGPASTDTTKPKADPREWFINPVVGYKCKVNENGIGLTGNEIHVVEYAALTEARERILELERTFAEYRATIGQKILDTHEPAAQPKNQPYKKCKTPGCKRAAPVNGVKCGKCRKEKRKA
jgi:hypothetical protein